MPVQAFVFQQAGSHGSRAQSVTVAYVLIKPGCIYEDLDFRALGTR